MDDMSYAEAAMLALARERIEERERAHAAPQATRVRGKRTLQEIRDRVGDRHVNCPLPVAPEPAPTHQCCCHHSVVEDQHPIESAVIRILTLSFLLRH